MMLCCKCPPQGHKQDCKIQCQVPTGDETFHFKKEVTAYFGKVTYGFQTEQQRKMFQFELMRAHNPCPKT